MSEVSVNVPEPTPTPAPKASGNAPGVIKRSNAFFLDPAYIDRREGWNPRFVFTEIEELANSIVANGILQPVRVKRKADGRFELIDGDRRMCAIELLLKEGRADQVMKDGVPAIVVDKAQADIKSLIQMFEANSGKPFLPMEEAAAYKRMRDAGMTLADIRAATGRSNTHIVDVIALVEADASLGEAVADGEVGPTLAKRIAVHARGNKTKQKELVQKAKEAGKNSEKRRELDKELDSVRREKNAKKGRVLKTRALSDIQLKALGEKVSESLDAKLKEAGLTETKSLNAWCAADDKLAVAYSYGALQALKAALGMKTNLDI